MTATVEERLRDALVAFAFSRGYVLDQRPEATLVIPVIQNTNASDAEPENLDVPTLLLVRRKGGSR